MRKGLIIAAVAFVASLATAFGVSYALGGPHTSYASSSPVDMTGVWQAKNMSALVTNDGTIEVDMTTEDSSSVYWRGTFAVGNLVVNTADVEITSQGDKAAMDASLFGSRDNTKTFVYHPKSNTITFKMTMLGTTQVITLKR